MLKGVHLREIMWGKLAKIEGHLRADLKTKCSENFISYIKAIIMKSPNKMRACRLLSPKKTCGTGNGFHQIECRPKVFHEILHHLAVAKTVSCPPQNDSEATLQKIITKTC